MRRATIAFLTLTILAVVGVPAINAAEPAEVIVTFDGTAGENPEGLAIDKTGTIYVSFPFIGELRAISPNGSQRLVTTLPTGSGFGPLGLAVDAPGNVYVCVVTFDPATQGIYRVDRNGGAVRLPGTQNIGFPNGLALDPRGNIYVGDSILGAVWRIPRGGSAAIWSQDSTLAGNGSGPLPFPVGANGVAFRKNTIYVTNTELGSVVRIPVRRDGSAGTPSVLASSPALGGADGIALDVHGNIYVPVIVQSTIVRVSPDGKDITTIATAADGLDFASSVAFGTGRGDRKTMYLVNFSIAPLFGLPPGSGPALLSIDAGVPGDPLP